MAIVQKNVRILYQAKLNITGLSNVKAQVYFNGVAKAVGASALALTEVDSTNSPGLYELLIPAATLTTWGVLAGQSNTVEGYISSTTAPAYAPFREEVTIANLDDISGLIGATTTGTLTGDIAGVQTKLGTPAGASVSADIAAVKSDTAAIKVDLETGASNLSAILGAVNGIASGVVLNGFNAVLPQGLIPTTGSNSYVANLTFYNNNGALVDPASNTITVGLKNAAGVDRGSYLTGSSGSPATVLATRVSVGVYTVAYAIPSTAVEEEIVFSFAATLGTNPIQRFQSSLLVADVAAAGYALQTTLLATQTAVNAIKADVENVTTGLIPIANTVNNGTYGNAAIQALLANATYGLSAIKTDVDSVGTQVAGVQTSLNNGTYGLSALQVQGAATQGTGFTAGTDDLHSLSTFIRANLAVGRAV